MISVSTEINEMNSGPSRGWVFFDGNCPFCRRWARRLEPFLAPRGFRFCPLQLPCVRAHFHLPVQELVSEMRVLMCDGAACGGADALAHLARYIWWASPLVALARIPGTLRLLRAGYRFIAARRQCPSGACALNQPPPNPTTQHEEGAIQ